MEHCMPFPQLSWSLIYLEFLSYVDQIWALFVRNSVPTVSERSTDHNRKYKIHSYLIGSSLLPVKFAWAFRKKLLDTFVAPVMCRASHHSTTNGCQFTFEFDINGERESEREREYRNRLRGIEEGFTTLACVVWTQDNACISEAVFSPSVGSFLKL